jgi:hypothetical protein
MLERARAVALQQLGVTEGLWMSFVEEGHTSLADVADMAAWLQTKMLLGGRIETTFGRMTPGQFIGEYKKRVRKAMEEAATPLPEAPRRRDLDREVDEGAREGAHALVAAAQEIGPPVFDEWTTALGESGKTIAEIQDLLGVGPFDQMLGNVRLFRRVRGVSVGAAPGMGGLAGFMSQTSMMLGTMAALGMEAPRRAPQFYGFEAFQRSIQERATGEQDKLDQERNGLLVALERGQQKLAKDKTIREEIRKAGVMK